MSPPAEDPARGRFVVIEGLDGSGTTTQAELLGRKLQAAGVSVELTKEPSNGPLGAVLRQAIEGRIRLDPKSLALAFAADRADHLLNEHNGIQRLLDQGQWVVCDRFVLSSLAYQPGGEIGVDWLESINKFAVQPDLTVFLDADLAVCLQRIAARSSAAELFHTREQLERVRQNYKSVLARGRDLGELLLIDGGDTIEAVAEAIWLGLVTRLPESRIAPSA